MVSAGGCWHATITLYIKSKMLYIMLSNFWTMLTKTEVDALLKLEDKEKTITELAELSLSIYRTYALVVSLERKGLVKTEKRGKYRMVSLSGTKPVEILRKLMIKFGHMPLEKILSGKNLALLAVLENIPLTSRELYVKSNLPRSTFYHVINNLSKYGLIGKRNGKYFLIEKYELFHIFAKEIYELQNLIRAREFSRNSVLVWSGVSEFILSTEEYKGKDVGNFHLTGLERFSDFGIDVIGAGRYHYYYSEKVRRLSLEDIIVHALLIDFSPRTILYSLVLLLTYKDKVNKKKLFELGKKYEVNTRTLLGYLKGKEVKRYPYHL